jgi:4-cresol dehydrogenase (hydroxylating)
VAHGQALSNELVQELAEGVAAAPWTGLGAIYGGREHARATRAVLNRVLGPHIKRLVFLDRRRLHVIRWLLGHIKLRRLAPFALAASRAADAVDLISGIPSRVALQLAYWKSAIDPPDEPQDPAKDGCGLIWYSPIVPMRPERVRCYVNMVHSVCRRHGMEAPITLTSLSERVFDSTLPLLFNRNNEEEAARAHECYVALFEAGRREGFIPYRVGVQFMPLIIDPSAPFWQLTNRIKMVLDPGQILAPGRYSSPTS